MTAEQERVLACQRQQLDSLLGFERYRRIVVEKLQDPHDGRQWCPQLVGHFRQRPLGGLRFPAAHPPRGGGNGGGSQNDDGNNDGGRAEQNEQERGERGERSTGGQGGR